MSAAPGGAEGDSGGDERPPLERRLRKLPWLDVLGVTLATLYALPTLDYVYGRDQAAFDYVGRGWLSGGLPYVAALDQKPPGIYAIYAIASLLPSGNLLRGVRVLELLAVLALGAVIAHVVRDPRSTSHRGGLGVSVLFLSGVHYTFFDYWNSGQPDFWGAMSVLSALAVVRSNASARRRAFGAGALVSLGCVFKPPTLLMGIGVLTFLVLRSSGDRTHRLRDALVASAAFIAGGAVVSAIVLFPYVATGNLHALVDTLVGFNAHYMKNTGINGNVGLSHSWVQKGFLYVSVGVLPAIVLAARGGSRDRRLAAEILTLSVLALGGVVLQHKFFVYHFGAMAPFLAAGGALGVGRLAGSAPLRVGLSAAVVIIGFLMGPRAPFGTSYRSYVADDVRYRLGRQSRDKFMERFKGNYGYSYIGSEIIGTIVREAAQPGDTLCIDAFEPTIYVIARMRCTSRFFDTQYFRDPLNATYRGGAWAAEYAAVLHDDPPTFIVELADDPTASVLTGRTYRTVNVVGAWRILRRTAEPVVSSDGRQQFGLDRHRPFR